MGWSHSHGSASIHHITFRVWRGIIPNKRLTMDCLEWILTWWPLKVRIGRWVIYPMFLEPYAGLPFYRGQTLNKTENQGND